MASVGLALLVLSGCLWLGLRRLEQTSLYHPERSLMLTPAAFGLKFEEVELITSDGLRLQGWFVPGQDDHPILLFLHGNGGNISHRVEKLRILRATGASVLVVDYRGYGKSSGRPTEEGTYRDAEAAYDYLTNSRGISPDRIIAHGESLGGAVALELTLRRPCGGLILESAFTSTVDMGRRAFPYLPVAWIVRYRYDNLSKIAKVGRPVLILHSPEDDIIPFEMGRRLFETADEPKRFVRLRGDHNSGFLSSEPEYRRAIEDFLRTLPGT